MKFYSVYDVKVQTYSDPFLQPTDAAAFRVFEATVKNPKTLLGQNPEDFGLWRLGEFDQETGKLIPETPIEVARALDFVAMDHPTPFNSGPPQRALERDPDTGIPLNHGSD